MLLTAEIRTNMREGGRCSYADPRLPPRTRALGWGDLDQKDGGDTVVAQRMHGDSGDGEIRSCTVTRNDSGDGEVRKWGIYGRRARMQDDSGDRLLETLWAAAQEARCVVVAGSQSREMLIASRRILPARPRSGSVTIREAAAVRAAPDAGSDRHSRVRARTHTPRARKNRIGNHLAVADRSTRPNYGCTQMLGRLGCS